MFNKLKATVVRIFGCSPISMEQQTFHVDDNDSLWGGEPEGFKVGKIYLRKPEQPGCSEECSLQRTLPFPIPPASYAKERAELDAVIAPMAPRADRHCKSRDIRISVNDVNAFQLLSNEYADTAEALLLNGLIEGSHLFSRQLDRYLTSKGKKVAQPERSMSRVKKALRRSCMDLQVTRFRKGKRYSLTDTQRAALTGDR